MPNAGDTKDTNELEKVQIDLPLPIFRWIEGIAEGDDMDAWFYQAMLMLEDRIRHQPGESPDSVLRPSQVEAAKSTFSQSDAGIKRLRFEFKPTVLEVLKTEATDHQRSLNAQVISMLEDCIKLLRRDAQSISKIGRGLERFK